MYSFLRNNPDYAQCTVATSFEEAVSGAKMQADVHSIWIIGGERIYKVIFLFFKDFFIKRIQLL